MNLTALNHALHCSPLKGTPRLALIVMALHADHHGRVRISQRDLAAMCNISPQAAANAISGLRGDGLVQVVDTGTGTAPSAYLLTAAGSTLAPSEQKPEPNPTAEREIQVDTKPLEQRSAQVEIAPDVAGSAPPQFAFQTAGITQDGYLRGTETQIAAIPSWAPRNAVGRVLAACRAEQHPQQQFYWHRREHAAELDQARSAADLTLDQLCERLEQRPSIPQPARMSALVQAAKEVR